ncbi:vitamin B12 dependent-methionine synthase activation domain-containing protein [Desulfallas thermosapovorans]|uniref:vitamin B12 dependent-methionine synthase activation domain-containing protein n=1 Tax=Desulfallas thermosapovorans TaxID=58137 RepID=UPI001412400F|nr:vitamin B12 dependent-methionine synthase activation domain-containing protein [Desulfallas thermosapovorans]
MTESVIWELGLPDVTVEDLFQAQGADYRKRPPRPATVSLYRRMLAEAALLARPVIIWREVGILGAGERELFLEQGQKLTSSLLVAVAGKAERLIIFAMTLGSALDQREHFYSQSGKTLEAYALDAAGTALIVKSSLTALTKIKEHYRDTGLKISFPMGPGHSYWSSLADMQSIFQLLPAEKIGLSLTESNLMLPRKSMAMVMGAGKNLPRFQDKTHCDFCSLNKKCQLSHFEQRC